MYAHSQTETHLSKLEWKCDVFGSYLMCLSLYEWMTLLSDGWKVHRFRIRFGWWVVMQQQPCTLNGCENFVYGKTFNRYNEIPYCVRADPPPMRMKVEGEASMSWCASIALYPRTRINCHKTGVSTVFDTHSVHVAHFGKYFLFVSVDVSIRNGDILCGTNNLDAIHVRRRWVIAIITNNTNNHDH